MISAGFNRRMRKTACTVVWKDHGLKCPWSHPIRVLKKIHGTGKQGTAARVTPVSKSLFRRFNY